MLGYRRIVQRWRRLSFVLRLRLQAIRTRSSLELDVAKTCRIDRGVRIVLQGGHNKITLGDKAWLGERVHIELRGGELYMGERTEIRAESVAHISGRFYMEYACAFSIRCMIHCGKSIEVCHYTTFGEYTSVMDGEHVHTQTDGYWWYIGPKAKMILKSVRIGVGCYIGAKVTIAKGANIGDYCRIGANSVVTRDIEPHTLAAGVPAKPIKKLV